MTKTTVVETFALGMGTVEFEVKGISSKDLLKVLNDFRNAKMVIYSNDGESVMLDVSDLIMDRMREYEDEDDFDGELIIEDGLEVA